MFSRELKKGSTELLILSLLTRQVYGLPALYAHSSNRVA